MNTLKDIADALKAGSRKLNASELARLTGLTRQSVAKALSGEQNFNVTSLLALAEANDQVVLIVPREVARALQTQGAPSEKVATMTDDLRKL